MLSLGEINRFDDYRTSDLPYTCGHTIHSYAFWSDVIAEWSELIPEIEVQHALTDMRGYKTPGVSNSVQNYLSIVTNIMAPMDKFSRFQKFICPELDKRRVYINKLYDAVRQISQTPILIDSSKSAHRFRLLHSLRPNTSKAIFLTRDGRAIAASNLRKNVATVPKSARKWWLANQFAISMMRTLPKSAYIHVRYEELCANPEKTAMRICSYIDVSYEPEMLDFRSHEQHIIGGNRMRMEEKSQIHEDLRWMSTLKVSEINEFERIAGRLNRKLLREFFREANV